MEKKKSQRPKPPPNLKGYEMIGDSQFCRLAEQLFGMKRTKLPNCPGRIGLCISGQTIPDLQRRVDENPISDKIVVLIGVNDFLKNVNVHRMCEEISALVRTLQKRASKIILLTLPPIPRLARMNSAHFDQLNIYNNHIRSLGNGSSVRIGDISHLFMNRHATSPSCNMDLFETHYRGGGKPDYVHLNKAGFQKVYLYVKDNF